MMDEALKALNESQIDLYYLYAIACSHKHKHAITRSTQVFTHADYTDNCLPPQHGHIFTPLQAQRVQMFYIQYWTAK